MDCGHGRWACHSRSTILFYCINIIVVNCKVIKSMKDRQQCHRIVEGWDWTGANDGGISWSI